MAGAGTRLRGCLTRLWGPREFYLALGVGLWLCGYFVADGWEQRKAFWWLVPILLLNLDLLGKTFRESRWLWAVAGLLAYQSASRWWSSGDEPVGNAFDVLMVLSLLTSLTAIGRRKEAASTMLGGLAVVAWGVTVVSLIRFYGADGHHLASDRLKNVLIYTEGAFPGLNSVLTGMLCGFGAVIAVWFSRRAEWRLGRLLWLACLAVLVFGLLASQSRGPMLAAGAGLAVLGFFLRREVIPALVTTAVTVGAFFAVVLRTDSAADLVERGSTGRLEIYQWFLGRLTLLDAVVGRGMSADVTIPEGELGWFVDHPHSPFLTQFLLTGAIGLILMLGVIGWAAYSAIGEARRQSALWLALIASGAVALLFDCGQIFSVYSAPRIELLLVAVPAALLMGRVGRGGCGVME